MWGQSTFWKTGTFEGSTFNREIIITQGLRNRLEHTLPGIHRSCAVYHSNTQQNSRKIINLKPSLVHHLPEFLPI